MILSATTPDLLRWDSLPRVLTLPKCEIHIWCERLNQPESRIQELLQTLAPDERSRAERFHFRKDRENFIVSHGILRAILGRYLNREPGQLRFCYGPYGKPALAGEGGSAPLRFNLSHADGLACFAIARGREVGIDLERIRTDMEEQQIAERFFSPLEAMTLRTLPAEMITVAFFNCWTRKEAYVKARGEGLSLPLNEFDVSLIPGDQPTLLSTRDDPEEASRWALQELNPAPGYVGALAAEGHDWQLKCWQLSE